MELEFTPEELASCMSNQSPGSPEMSVLSFKSGFHGRLFGSLSATRSKAIHKVGIPAFDCEIYQVCGILLDTDTDWTGPAVAWPEIKYPMEEFVTENAEAEARCLAEVERVIKEQCVSPLGIRV